MCTAVSWTSGDHYFGRNLDLHYSYPETVTVTPRRYPLYFREMPPLLKHHAIIGIATVVNDYPLYYDATNEKGLSIAGLNFPLSAYYPTNVSAKQKIAPFELIPWILGQCATVADAIHLLEQMQIVHISYSDDLPVTPLHWMIADANQSIVVESTLSGLHIHNNDVGILTNEPPFDYHRYHMQSFMQLSAKSPQNNFSADYPFVTQSNGSGSFGLPGDYSSESRFIRAAFVKMNSKAKHTESERVNQFFRILDSVSMPHGCVEIHPGEFEITRYSSCCNTSKGIYYYTTYENKQITAVDMHKENLEENRAISYPLLTSPNILPQN